MSPDQQEWTKLAQNKPTHKMFNILDSVSNIYFLHVAKFIN